MTPTTSGTAPAPATTARTAPATAPATTARTAPATARSGTGRATTTPSGPAPRSGTARERLLAAADELFYAEGIHTVGIDRVIERAGVAKASLYSTFGSKDELVRAYLGRRHDRQVARIARYLDPLDDPRAKLLALFDAQAELFATPGFHGCAFANAAAESEADSVAATEAAGYRRWLRDLVEGVARDAGARDPELLARNLVMLYDGANLSRRMDANADAAAHAKVAASALIDAALA